MVGRKRKGGRPVMRPELVVTPPQQSPVGAAGLGKTPMGGNELGKNQGSPNISSIEQVIQSAQEMMAEKVPAADIALEIQMRLQNLHQNPEDGEQEAQPVIQGGSVGAPANQLGNLNFLDVSDNIISGELPAVLPPSLIEFVVRDNQLEGNIPASAANLNYLQVMDLSHNKLSGSVPTGLFAHPVLEQLTLSYNRFGSVQVPGDSGLSSQLISVDLSNNKLRRFLPVFMGLMPRLSALSLENNKFSGWIPTQYVLKVVVPGMGMGQGVAQFERLLLGGNYLFRPIPGGFMNLKPGSVTVRLGDNCLYRCPLRLFFCESRVQNSLMDCKAFGPIIP
ncbi:hypothetical protein BUALT_Bualt04G0008200 [Buddleja alternifolia]|uniref:Uncharacterized protein n=1 Tax=Buddleja alternifolia TaxID=168488 RepID=A0AAV6XRV1_9LAMI|nr:hypothetical protein BUALT_Bualt04G0008200 [Buddleja alternifolia]